MAKKITQKRLKELLHYNQETGIFTALIKRGRTGVGDMVGGINKQKGYIQMWLDGNIYRGHVLVWLYMTGNYPTYEIDHINRIKSDNRWCNLRDVPHKVNMNNRKDNLNGGVGSKYIPKVKWGVTTPDGDVKLIISLSEFCRENNLSYYYMYMVGCGKSIKDNCKGYRCIKL